MPEVLDQYERHNAKQPKEVFVDRGYRGVNQYKESGIFVPKTKKLKIDFWVLGYLGFICKS